MHLKDMSIRWKVILIGMAGLLLVSIVSGVQRVHDIRSGAEEAIVEKSRAIVRMAEATRDQMAKKLAMGVIRPLNELDGSALMEAVPIVSAMNVAMENAKAGDYVFRVPKVSPRNPKNEPIPLELAALKEMEADNLTEKVVREPGQIRYFRPIRLTSECLYCHGDPRGGKDPLGGTKEGWKEGEIHGAFEVVSSLAAADAAVSSARISVAGWMGLILVLVGSASWLLFAKNVSNPLRSCSKFIGVVSAGDFTGTIPDTKKDEFGVMMRELSRMAASLRTTFRFMKGSIGAISIASGEMTDKSRLTLAAAEKTSERSRRVAVASEEMSSNMSSIAAAAEHISQNLDSVAAASEEMTATIHEITQNIERTKRVTTDMQGQAKSASTRLDSLGISTQEIGKITETITGISEQTNLLALNATIEAARAGEAGKGFAVVANEIKVLSSQTAVATKEIKLGIEDMQKVANQTVSEIREILKVVGEIGEMVSSVAAVTEQQSITARDIAGSMGRVSHAVGEVTENVAQASAVSEGIASDIGGVNVDAQQISAQSSHVIIYAEECSKFAEQLQQFIDKYEVGKARFDIGKVKNAHLGWKSRLEAVLRGHVSMKPEEVASHKTCDFGKWFFSAEGQSLSSLPAFAEIAKFHEEVHRHARDIVALIQSKSDKEARSRLAQFEESRKNLFAALDDLYNG